MVSSKIEADTAWSWENARDAAGCGVVEERKKGKGWVWRTTARDDAANSSTRQPEHGRLCRIQPAIEGILPLEAGR